MRGPLVEARRVARDGVQSLCSRGPTLAGAFVQAGLVTLLLLSRRASPARAWPRRLAEPLALTRLCSRQIGGDVLLEAYVCEP